MPTEPSVATVMITGIALVFGVLLLLFVVVTLQGMFFAKHGQKQKPARDTAKPARPVKQEAGDEALHAAVLGAVANHQEQSIVAAITAAVSEMMGGKPFSIQSIRRAKQAKGRGAWGNAGVQDNTSPF